MGRQRDRGVGETRTGGRIGKETGVRGDNTKQAYMERGKENGGGRGDRKRRGWGTRIGDRTGVSGETGKRNRSMGRQVKDGRMSRRQE